MKLTGEEIRFMNALEEVTGARARSCLANSKEVTFVVSSGEMGKAIGKQGQKIRALKSKIGRNIQVFEHYEKPEDFLKMAFGKENIEEVSVDSENGTVNVKLGVHKKNVFFNDSGKMRRIREIMKQNYGMNEIKIR